LSLLVVRGSPTLNASYIIGEPINNSNENV
jgi:hypothetical protein